MTIPILGGEERTVYSADEVKTMLEQSLQHQFQQITQDQFVQLYFALIQLGFSERVKAHKSWAENTATGLAEQAHQTVTAAFDRLGRVQKERQAAVAMAMAEAEKKAEVDKRRAVMKAAAAGNSVQAGPPGLAGDVWKEQPTAEDKPANEAT